MATTVEMITQGLDQIEDKMISSLENMSVKHRELSNRLLQIEQKGGAEQHGGHDFRTAAGGASLGAKVWNELKKNAELLSKTDRLRLDIKAAGDVTGTGSARTIVSGGVGVASGMALGAQYGFSVRNIGATSAVEYSRYTGIEGAAGLQAADGDAKSAVRPTFSLISQPSLTIAGYSKVSKQALNDQSELTRAIDITLRRSIGKALDSVLCSGTWGGAAGLLAHATAMTSLTYPLLADASSEGVAAMQEDGFSPDVLVMKPADWFATIVETGQDDHYLSGNYLGVLPYQMRGLRVILSPSIPTGKALILDSSQIELLIVEDLSVEIGTDADDFTRNVRTILGELRIVPTYRAVGAAKLITPRIP